MRKFIIFAVFSLVIFPFVSSAHEEVDSAGSENFSDGLEMMRYMEDVVLGDELHSEMESLMIKMMSGEMNQEEAQRMIDFMNQYQADYLVS